jgi:hypothetical protein
VFDCSGEAGAKENVSQRIEAQFVPQRIQHSDITE